MKKTATVADLETARSRLLKRRQAVLTAGGPHSQEMGSRLWSDVLILEHAIARKRWGR